MCAFEIEESSWYPVLVSSNKEERRALRVETDYKYWSPLASDARPTIWVLLAKGGDAVYIETFQMPDIEGVTQFVVQPMSVDRQPVVRESFSHVTFEPCSFSEW